MFSLSIFRDCFIWEWSKNISPSTHTLTEIRTVVRTPIRCRGKIFMIIRNEWSASTKNNFDEIGIGDLSKLRAFRHSRTILSRFRRKEQNQKLFNRIVHNNTKLYWDLEVRNQMSGYGGLSSKIEMSKLIAVLWHFPTIKIAAERTKSMLFTSKSPLQLNGYRLRPWWEI